MYAQFNIMYLHFLIHKMSQLMHYCYNINAHSISVTRIIFIFELSYTYMLTYYRGISGIAK